MSEKKLSNLLLKFSELEEEAGISFFAAFSVDNKQENKKEFNLFCIAKDREKFKQLLESEGLQANELAGFMITDDNNTALRVGHKNVLSGIGVNAFVYCANPKVGEKASTYYVEDRLADGKS